MDDATFADLKRLFDLMASRGIRMRRISSASSRIAAFPSEPFCWRWEAIAPSRSPCMTRCSAWRKTTFASTA